MPKSFDDAEHWRRRAEEARAHADQMNDEKSRKMMLGIAMDYDRLAARAEERSKTVAAIKIATPGPWAADSEKAGVSGPRWPALDRRSPQQLR